MTINKYNIAAIYVFFGCVITFTKSYVLFAYLAGTSVSVITALFFLGNLALIYYYQKVIVKKNFLIIISLFLVILPYLFSIVNRFILPSALLLQLFYLSQVLVGAVAVVRFREVVKKAIIVAVIINFIVGIASITLPSLFIPLSEINDSRVFYGGRAIGFFLQPNAYGVSNVVLMIAASIFCSRKTFHYLYPILLASVILSFSRSAIGLYLIATLISVGFSWVRGDLKLRAYVKPALRVLTVFGIGFVLFLSSPYSSVVDDIQSYTQVYSRIEFFLNISSQSVAEDASIADRTNYQQRYIDQLPNIIAVGKGVGAQRFDIESGVLAGSAHMAHLEILYTGGLYYWVSFIFLLFAIGYIAFKNFKRFNEKSYFSVQILLFMFVFSFFSTGILAMRELYLVIGLMAQFSNHVKIGFIEIDN